MKRECGPKGGSYPVPGGNKIGAPRRASSRTSESTESESIRHFLTL